MNRILTSFASSGQPFTSPTSLDHLQDAYYEGFVSMIRNLIGPKYDATKAYALWGCYTTTTPSITAGAIFFENEIWLVDAWAPGVSCGPGTVPVLNKQLTYVSSDPLTYEDGSTHNTHQIRKIVASCATSGSGNVCNMADLQRVLTPTRFTSVGTSLGGVAPTIDFTQNTFTNYAGIGGSGATVTLNVSKATNGATVEIRCSGGSVAGQTITLAGSGYNTFCINNASGFPYTATNSTVTIRLRCIWDETSSIWTVVTEIFDI